jgi:hypothetical protein
MDERYLAEAGEHLEARGIELQEGLNEVEIHQVESRYDFRFPPDLLAFLRRALPVSPGFPNWRSEDDTELRLALTHPADGIAFDVERNNFWMDEWGSRPTDPHRAISHTREMVAAAPFLVPVYEHRYIPCEPLEDGNPIFSVWQTDIIYYGNDLAGYLHEEFGVPRPPWARNTARPIRVWTRLVEENR